MTQQTVDFGAKQIGVHVNLSKDGVLLKFEVTEPFGRTRITYASDGETRGQAKLTIKVMDSEGKTIPNGDDVQNMNEAASRVTDVLTPIGKYTATVMPSDPIAFAITMAHLKVAEQSASPTR